MVIKRISLPGNVLLDVDKANLPRQSVVEVSKVTSLDKTHERLSRLSRNCR